jgi:hypothetical protein
MYNNIEKLSTGMHGIMVSPDSIKKLLNEKRLLCTINGVAFHCALMGRKEGNYHIAIGATIMKKAGLKIGMVVNPVFKKDASEFQFEMPEALAEVLRTDEKANAAFAKLTDGNKRGLMYLVNNVKSMDKKIERALLIAEKIKHGISSPRLVMQK